MADKYRLITRSDFDGLMSAVLLKELDMVDTVEFVHPKDMQDGKVAVTDRDITANLPYVEGVHLAFDHHASELTRVGEQKNFITEPDAPSAARVIWKHYGGAAKFPNISEQLMAAVDKSDSAQFERDEILNPEGWVLLSFIMDARTGLGRFHDFRISNRDLMFKMIDLIGQSSLGDILGDEDVVERAELYKRHAAINAAQIERCGKLHKNLVVLDLRREDEIYAGNRFVIYAMFPQANISVHVMWGKQQQNVVFACGKSILDRSSKTNVGELMLKHGGGGHVAAGTCQVPPDKADEVLKDLIETITSDG
ncbi:MAG: exopolyphosphatase [Planctomycetes bacterium]|nr:exopolyphosphatase [Planctomycetota bacterium]